MSRPPIAALGALGTTRSVWHRFDSAMGGHRVLAFDVPAGPQTALEPAVAQLKQSMAAPAAAVDSGVRFDIVSVGFGCCLAIGLALQYPHYVRRLVLAAPTAHPGNAQMWLARGSAIEADGWAPHARAIVDRWGGTSAERDQWAEDLSSLHPRWYASACQLAAKVDLLPRLREIQCPTLVVKAGSDTALGPEHADAIISGVSSASSVLLPEAGHLAMLSDSFAPTVQAFLDDPT